MIQIDMEMPDNCYCCILCRHADMFCRRLGKFLDRDDCYDERDRNCPLHEVTADSDTISRKQAIDALEFDYAYAAAKIIKALPPSLTPNRPKGQWIKGKMWSEGIGMGETYGFYYSCSECNSSVQGGYDVCGKNFCEKCGADMRQHEHTASLETPCDDCDFYDRCTYESDCPRGAIWEAEHEYDE